MSFSMKGTLQAAPLDATQHSTANNGGGSASVHIQMHGGTGTATAGGTTTAPAVQQDTPSAPSPPTGPTCTPPTEVEFSVLLRAAVSPGGRPRVSTVMAQPTARRPHWSTAEPAIPLGPATSTATIEAAAAAAAAAAAEHVLQSHFQHHAAQQATQSTQATQATQSLGAELPPRFARSGM